MSARAKSQKKSSADRIAAARDELEESTSIVLNLVRRNAFIGDPVTTFEARVRKARDLLIRRQLSRAKRALTTLAAIAERRRPV